MRRAGQRLRITAQLTGVRDGRTLWSERYDRELADVFAIQDEIARTIVDTLARDAAPGPRRPRRRCATPRTSRPTSCTSRAATAWNRRTQAAIAEGIRYFEAAIAEDAGYALAYTGLADSYALQLDYRGAPVREGFERARAEARHALALDETLAEAHTSLAWVTFIYDWDWPLAGPALPPRDRAQSPLLRRPAVALVVPDRDGAHGARHRRGTAGDRARPRLGLDPAEHGLAALLRPPARAGARAAAPRPGDESHRRGEPPAPRAHLPAASASGTRRRRRSARRIAISESPALAEAGLGAVAAARGRPEEARAILAELDARRRDAYVSPVAFVMVHSGPRRGRPRFEWLDRRLRGTARVARLSQRRAAARRPARRSALPPAGGADASGVMHPIVTEADLALLSPRRSPCSTSTVRSARRAAWRTRRCSRSGGCATCRSSWSM